MIPNKDPKLDEQLKKIWRASAERLTEREAAKERVGYLDLTKTAVQIDALKLISKEQAERAHAVIFEQKNNLVALAAINPESDEVKQVSADLAKKGMIVKTFIISPASFEYALTFYQFVPKQTESVSARMDIEPERVLELEKQLTSLIKVEEAFVSLLTNNPAPGEVLNIVLAGALTNRASDIHFEPGEQGVRLRYRIDGVLRDVVAAFGKETYHLLLSRIKLLASLRLNITNVAQDGRFTVGLGGVQIELRISVIPSEFGETIVMRILDPRVIQLKMADLGMRPDDLAIVEDQLKAPNGMILNTGPTGSGKTTTLYAFLRKVASPEIKIITIEDPIEYHLTGIEQTQVDLRSGYTFSNGLQAMMRQDPDVILVGEIRDKDTAEIAIQAALTGHLVFSTLHTNSAAGVIPRLLDLGAPQTSIGPALNLIIAQRLIRRLCQTCRKPKEATPELLAKIQKIVESLPARVNKKPYEVPKLFEANDQGCDQCHMSGYRGRLGIFELLEVGEELEELINRHATEGEIMKFALSKGLVTLQQAGILKALEGETSFAEVENVTGPILGLR